MAHTLSITYGETPTTISLSGSGASAGISLGDGQGSGGYQPSEAVRDVVYNASLYQDGDRPVFDRAANIRETFTVTIKGSSVDDMLSRLRALKSAVWWARDYYKLPSMRSPAYLSFKPSGSTNTAYSAILGGDVQEPDMLQTEIVNYTIHNVRVTIEREPFWRKYAPVRATIPETGYEGQGGVTQDTKTFAAFSIGTVAGDIPALMSVYVYPAYNNVKPATIGKFILGLRSSARFPATINGLAYYAGGVMECEGGSLTGCTDTSLTTDTTASPGGGGNTKVNCTFTTATNAKRVILTAPSRLYGKYRAFLRMKAASAVTVTAYLNYYKSSSNSNTTTTAQSITLGTAWKFLDLGVVQGMEPGNLTLVNPFANAPDTIEIYASATATVTVGMDALVLVPCDEYYATCTGTDTDGTNGSFGFVVSNVPPASSGYPYQIEVGTPGGYISGNPFKGGGIGTGTLMFPPGTGTIVYIATQADGTSVTVNSNKEMSIDVYAVPRYLTARGAS